MLEKIQRRATKLIPRPRDLRYEERLKECGLTTPETRRLMGDQIEVFKILNGYHHIVSATALIHRTARPSISAMSSLLGISPKCVQLVMIWFRSHVAAPHIQCLFSR